MFPKKIVIATFSFRKDKTRSPLNGMIEPLLFYFQERTKQITMIDGMHPGSDSVLSYFEIYKNKKLFKKQTSIVSLCMFPILYFQNNNATQISFKIRDFFCALESIIRNPIRYDLYIGLESIYTIAGIVLKKFGYVNKVVYYVSDYTPTRFTNKKINTIYLWLDKFCCYHADVIWDVSPAMMPARIKAGLDEKKSQKVVLTPNALFPKQISYNSISETIPNSLIFAGTFGPENGPLLAIQSLEIALKKNKKLQLHMIGGGDKYEDDLKKYVVKHKLEKNVTFHGFIKNAIEISTLTKQFRVGIAPYTSIPQSTRWYADATKIRLYLGAGLPVITTQVPPLAKDKAIKKCIITTIDTKEKLAEAIIEIFKSDEKYHEMREHAIKYAKNNTWDNTYNNAIKQTFQ